MFTLFAAAYWQSICSHWLRVWGLIFHCIFCYKLKFKPAIEKTDFEGQIWRVFKPSSLILKDRKLQLFTQLKINSTLLQSFFFVRFKVLPSFHSWSFSSWFWSRPKRLCKSNLNNTRRGQFCVAGVFSRKGFPRINPVFQSCDWYLLFYVLKFLLYL